MILYSWLDIRDFRTNHIYPFLIMKFNSIGLHAYCSLVDSTLNSWVRGSWQSRSLFLRRLQPSERNIIDFRYELWSLLVAFVIGDTFRIHKILRWTLATHFSRMSDRYDPTPVTNLKRKRVATVQPRRIQMLLILWCLQYACSLLDLNQTVQENYFAKQEMNCLFAI